MRANRLATAAIFFASAPLAWGQLSLNQRSSDHIRAPRPAPGVFSPHQGVNNGNLHGTPTIGNASFGLDALGLADSGSPAIALEAARFSFDHPLGSPSAPRPSHVSEEASLFRFIAAAPARNGALRPAGQIREVLFPLPPLFKRLTARPTDRSSSTFFSLATINRMMRGDLYLPFGSNVGGVRFDYDDRQQPGNKPGAISGSASALFTSALRNGMTVSAGALFGIRSAAFSPTGYTHSTVPTQRTSCPSFGLKLSF